VAAPPGPARPAPTGPITWVEPTDASRGAFGDTPLETSRSDVQPSGPALFDPDTELRRRVPQSNLASELRAGPPGPVQSEPAQRGHNQAAASALSRYQASREAARTAVHSSHPAGRSDEVPLDAAGDDPPTAHEHATRPGAVSDGAVAAEDRAVDRAAPDGPPAGDPTDGGR
jgi:hypothetical protein